MPRIAYPRTSLHYVAFFWPSLLSTHDQVTLDGHFIIKHFVVLPNEKLLGSIMARIIFDKYGSNVAQNFVRVSIGPLTAPSIWQLDAGEPHRLKSSQ